MPKTKCAVRITIVLAFEDESEAIKAAEAFRAATKAISDIEGVPGSIRAELLSREPVASNPLAN
jgi:hypothetical protein